jgi:succinate dehydrogenase / fumarate reductase cytochrome b subunit
MAEHKSRAPAGVKRPLSPHLQIYSPSISMVMSVLHRMTGAALYMGMLILAWWLFAAAQGPEYFAYVSSVMGSTPGRIVLFGFTWALFHHMLGGIRHFFWDTIHGHDLKSVSLLSWATIGLSLLLTALLWISIWTRGSGATP